MTTTRTTRNLSAPMDRPGHNAAIGSHPIGTSGRLLLTCLLLCVGCSQPAHERAVAKASMGAQWPFTVTNGVVACRNGSQVVFIANGITYAINGTAKTVADREGYRSDEPIRERRPLGEVKTRVDRFPESLRKSVFESAAACDGLPGDQLDACRATIRDGMRLTSSELAQIIEEGVTLGWPPLNPYLAPVGPIIDIGLQLCAS